jgi:Protein of unknown function (DUF1579)
MAHPVVHVEIGCQGSAKTRELYRKLFDWRIEEIGPAAMIVLASLLVAVSLALPARLAAQENPVEKPGAAELARLKFYLGEWDYTETYPKSAVWPDGAKNTGVYTSKLGPGGNSLINSFHSRGPVGDFEGLLVMTWDDQERAYKSYAFSSLSPGAVVQTGQFEGDTLVYRAELPAGGVTLKLRNTTRLTGEGKLESDQFFATNDGPETLMVHVEAKKR